MKNWLKKSFEQIILVAIILAIVIYIYSTDYVGIGILDYFITLVIAIIIIFIYNLVSKYIKSFKLKIEKR